VKDAVAPLFFTPYRQDDNLGFITFYVRTALRRSTRFARCGTSSGPDPYSWERAATGSMRVARRAGITQAVTAAAPRNSTAMASTPGSLSRTP